MTNTLTVPSLTARTVAVFAAAVLTVALAGLATADSSNDPGRDKEVVLELETHPTSHFQNPVGTSKAGTTIGGTGGLTRFDRGDESAYGFDRWQCLYLEVTPGNERRVMQCQSTFETPDGEITFQGAWTELGGPPRTSEDAITGGTGKYRNATGYAVYELLNPGDPANARYHVTMHLGKAHGS